MGVHRLNHAVLYVRDADVTASFYERVLGFTRKPGVEFPGAVFLVAPDSTNDHDLGLFSVGSAALAPRAGRRSVGLYHLAWEVDTLGDLQEAALVLQEAGALKGASDHGTSKSLYALDPDGIEFEVVWLIPADQLQPADLEAQTTISRLDLPAEIARFGADLRGGVGISRPA